MSRSWQGACATTDVDVKTSSQLIKARLALLHLTPTSKLGQWMASRWPQFIRFHRYGSRLVQIGDFQTKIATLGLVKGYPFPCLTQALHLLSCWAKSLKPRTRCDAGAVWRLGWLCSVRFCWVGSSYIGRGGLLQGPRNSIPHGVTLLDYPYSCHDSSIKSIGVEVNVIVSAFEQAGPAGRKLMKIICGCWLFVITFFSKRIIVTQTPLVRCFAPGANYQL